MARPKAALTVTRDEKLTLERLVRRRKSSQQESFRARIVLLCAEGHTNQDVAKMVGACGATVGKWRARFLEQRLDGLLDAPRPGTPRKLSDDAIERVLVTTLETSPKGATHWSTRLMAKQTGISQSSVGRIWRAFGLAPHRTESFKLSTDPFFIEKVRDICGLYLNPPSHALVLCVDEKSQIQALNRTQPLLPMRPGQAERRTHDYKRNGTTSLFAALDLASGKVLGRCYRRHRATEYRRFLDLIDRAVPQHLDVHIIVDNYSTHKTPSIQRWFAKRPRFHVHFTPTYASWLNLVERWFGLLTERQIKRGSHHSTGELERAIYEFIEVTNDAPKPFIWTKSADEILDKVGRFCQGTLVAHGSSTNL